MRLVHRGTSGPNPTSSFDLVDDAGETVGFCQVRHRPSCAAELPPKAANHIYYEIAAVHRERGYGKMILALALDKARRIGLEAVRITAAIDNPASRRIIETNGGVWVGDVISKNGERIQLFRISLR